MLLSIGKITKRSAGLTVTVPRAWMLELDLEIGNTVYAAPSLNGEIRYELQFEPRSVPVKIRRENSTSNTPVLTVPRSIAIHAGLVAGDRVKLAVDTGTNALVVTEDLPA